MLLCLGIACVLFPGLAFDAWFAADPDLFTRMHVDHEAFVLGRVVASRTWGLFSHGALLGRVSATDAESPWTVEAFALQREAYERGTTVRRFTPYRSHNGLQALPLALADRLSPATPAGNLEALRLGHALLTALALAAVIAWFGAEFGFLVAALLTLSVCFSQWLTLMGRHVYWSLWSFFLPLLAALWAFRPGRLRGEPRATLVASLAVLGAVLAKCAFSGLEYILTTVLTPVVPLVYYAIRDRWPRRALVLRVLAVGVAANLAVVVSLALLIVQIGAAQGQGPTAAIGYLHETVVRRTYGTDNAHSTAYVQGAATPLGSVLRRYSGCILVNLNHLLDTTPLSVRGRRHLLNLTVTELTLLGGVATMCSWWLRRRSPAAQRRLGALVALWAASLVPPMAWLVVFKSHSFYHVHQSPIIWHMPYALALGAVCAVGAGDVLLGALRLVRGQPLRACAAVPA